MSRKYYEDRLFPTADEDFADIINYIAAERICSAKSLVIKFEKYFKLLTYNPRLGRIPKENELASFGYRVIIIENYLMFYTIEENIIYLHRIIHGARDYISLL